MGGPAWQALIADIVPSKDRGKVMGLMGTITGIVGIPAGYMGGVMYNYSPDILLWFGAAFELLAIPLILFFVKEPRRGDARQSAGERQKVQGA